MDPREEGKPGRQAPEPRGEGQKPKPPIVKLEGRIAPRLPAHHNQAGVRAAALALLLLAFVAPVGADPGNDNRAPDLGDCQDLQVPAGNKVGFHAYAEGVQIYRWTGTRWAFVAPEAVLYAGDEDDGPVGIHYAGPTWESASGSIVVGAVLERCTPDPDAIPWLLLGAVDS